VSDRQREEITNALDSQCLNESERNLLVAVYPSNKPVSLRSIAYLQPTIL